jgi:hypothetical protein
VTGAGRIGRVAAPAFGDNVGMKPAIHPPKVDESKAPPRFDPDNTQTFQAKMPAAPVWFSSMVAGNSREKNRLRLEIEQIRGAVTLLMKQRNGGRWTAQDKQELKRILRSVSSVSPYLLIWVLPGSMLILPFLAWHLDKRRKRRNRGVQGT